MRTACSIESRFHTQTIEIRCAQHRTISLRQYFFSFRICFFRLQKKWRKKVHAAKSARRLRHAMPCVCCVYRNPNLIMPNNTMGNWKKTFHRVVGVIYDMRRSPTLTSLRVCGPCEPEAGQVYMACPRGQQHSVYRIRRKIEWRRR